MKKILILFAHPRFEKSRANKLLTLHIPKRDNITFHDLYECYPNFNIDIEYEKKLISEHKIIVCQFPVYWYSAPAMLKQWMEMVLEYGWAYGSKENALKGKIMLNVVTTGGQRKLYQAGQRNRYSIRDFLLPYEQSAKTCQMIYLPPFAVQGTYKLTNDDLEIYAKQYDILLQKLLDGELDYEELQNLEVINDICKL